MKSPTFLALQTNQREPRLYRAEVRNWEKERGTTYYIITVEVSAKGSERTFPIKKRWTDFTHLESLLEEQYGPIFSSLNIQSQSDPMSNTLLAVSSYCELEHSTVAGSLQIDDLSKKRIDILNGALEMLTSPTFLTLTQVRHFLSISTGDVTSGMGQAAMNMVASEDAKIVAGKLLSTEHQDLVSCSITKMPMTDPVQAPDGYTYERSAITQWLVLKGRSPITSMPMSVSNLVENRAVKAIINSLAPSEESHITKGAGGVASLEPLLEHPEPTHSEQEARLDAACEDTPLFKECGAESLMQFDLGSSCYSETQGLKPKVSIYSFVFASVHPPDFC